METISILETLKICGEEKLDNQEMASIFASNKDKINMSHADLTFSMIIIVGKLITELIQNE